MIINCSKNLLADTLQTVSKATSVKSNLAVLEGIFIKADEQGEITLMGNDLEIGIEAKIKGDVTEGGRVVLNAKMLLAIVRSMSSENITIEVSNTYSCTIKGGNSKFEISGIDPIEFPEIVKVDTDYDIELSTDILKNMISKTAFSVSQSDQRPVLKGCLLEIKGNKLKMVAVDKFRMAIREEEIEENLPEKTIIIPEKTLNEISKILKDNDKVSIKCNSKNVVFGFENYRVVSRLIEGEFIKYEAAIAKEFEIELEISKNDLLDTIQRASLMMNSETFKSPLKIKISGDEVEIFCETAQGSFDDSISVPTGDANLLIGFNNTFLIDALRAPDEEIIKIKFNKNINPMVITPVEGEKFLYLVLPMKI